MTAKKSAPAYDKKVLQEISELLHEKKNALLEKYAHWEDNSKPSGLKEMGDIADIASEINEETLSSVLSEAEIETIREIDAALEKIEEGTYGVCEGTGKKIPIARLKAIPWTRYTVEYAETLSKSKGFSRKNAGVLQALIKSHLIWIRWMIEFFICFLLSNFSF
ncbi:putative RNA polymerase-binding protein DksA [Leptospira kirschneri serovar Bim str. 1051]|nr:putative RNA polymerase-binding protein DksA [Leptospira kirschneri serovar Bim str. 1051]